MIKDIRHTGIVVLDLKVSLYFYCNLLGFKIIKQMEESGSFINSILSLDNVKVTTIKMVAGSGQLIELLKYHSHSGEKSIYEIYHTGLSHIAFTVDHLDDEYNRLRAKGIKFNSPPQLSPDGYAKVAFCRAPEGTWIELVEILS